MRQIKDRLDKAGVGLKTRERPQVRLEIWATGLTSWTDVKGEHERLNHDSRRIIETMLMYT